MISINQRQAVKAKLTALYHQQFCHAQKAMVPTEGILTFLQFCIGSRAECNRVGTFGKHMYVDLKSAFVAALLMLMDHEMRRCFLTTGANAGYRRMRSLMPFGPFQLIGLQVSWVLKPGFEPSLPMKVKGRKYNGEQTETVIYPVSGHGPIMWTEFWSVYTAGGFERFTIHEIIEFEPLETNHLAGKIGELLMLRHGDDVGIYKSILTHYYGKSLSGLRDLKDSHFNISTLSSIFCPPLAAYMVAVCRAIIGELIRLNPWSAIAADAVIIEGHQDVVLGPLALAIQTEMAKLNHQFICTEFYGESGFGLKARAYLLFGYKVKGDVISGTPSLKMAAMGMKTDKKRDEHDPVQLGRQQVDDYMTGLITGKLRCYNVQAFSRLEREYKQIKEQKEELQRELKNGRNKLSRLRKAAGISSEILKIEHHTQQIEQPFEDYEQQRISKYIAVGGAKAEALAKVLSEYKELRRQYDEVNSRQVFPREYFYTVKVNHTYDFKRVPVLESVVPETIEFDYGPSDGSSSTHYRFDHVGFETRPLYSADEYYSMIRNASYRMDATDYRNMLTKLDDAGVMSNHHKQ